MSLNELIILVADQERDRISHVYERDIIIAQFRTWHLMCDRTVNTGELRDDIALFIGRK